MWLLATGVVVDVEPVSTTKIRCITIQGWREVKMGLGVGAELSASVFQSSSSPGLGTSVTERKSMIVVKGRGEE